jgi:hypothetical protein
MKNLKIALGMVSVFAILIFTACNPSSSPTPTPPPNPVPTPTPAKITTSVIAPSTGSIILDGSGVGTKAIVGVTSTGNPAPVVAVDGIPFSGNQYTSPDIFESRDIVFTASNTAGADTKKVSIQVTIDPVFAKIAGNSISGKTWLLIDQTKQPVSGGTVVSFMTSCYADDKYTFRPNLKSIVDFGNDQSCTFKGKDSANYKFNKVTMVLQFLPEQETNPPMEVSFPAPNQMRLRHERDSYIWVMLFQEI